MLRRTEGGEALILRKAWHSGFQTLPMMMSLTYQDKVAAPVGEHKAGAGSALWPWIPTSSRNGTPQNDQEAGLISKFSEVIAY